MSLIKIPRRRRLDLLVNVLQAICILVFVACVALDPELHISGQKQPTQTKQAEVR